MLIKTIKSLSSWSMDIVHKNLIIIINNLYDVIIDKNIENINKNLEELYKDITNHFEFEEKLMQKYKYLKYEEHKVRHDNMYKNFKKEYNYWNKNMDFKRLKLYLKNILADEIVNHIWTLDVELSIFLVKKWVW